MGILFSNWLDEGYYESDGYGDLTQITDPSEIIRAQKEGNLYENDGMGTTKVDNNDIDLNLYNAKNKG